MLGTHPRVTARRVVADRGQMIAAEGAEAAAEALVRDAYEGTSQAYVDEVRPFFDRVEEQWPVATGFSKGALELEMRIVGGAVVASIRNIASYAGYIRQRKFRVPHVATRLVFNPSKALADRLLERIGHLLAD